MSRRKHAEVPVKPVTGAGPAGRAYETRDLPVRTAVLTLGALVVISALFLVVTSVFQFAYVGRLPCLCPPNGVFSVSATAVPTAVVRRQNPDSEVDQYATEEQQRLHTYGWIDQSAGVVHIPIERAMDLLLQRGLPTRPPDPANQFQDKGDTLPAYSSSGRTMEEQNH